MRIWLKKTYELSVYRAIGYSRFALTKRFIIDIFVILTSSSLLLYGLTTYVVYRLQIYLTGRANYFLVTFPSVLIGIIIIYTIGIIGLIPIVRLLRKSPAELLSQYDI